MATLIELMIRANHAAPPSRDGSLAAIILLSAFAVAGFAQSTTNPVFAARAEKAFQQAQTQFASDTNDVRRLAVCPRLF